MNPILGTEEYLKHWEDIISTVDKVNFPLELAHSVSFKIDEFSKKKTIDISELHEQGFTNNQIEEIVFQTMSEYPKRDDAMEFKFNIIGISVKVQAETDKILKNLN